jgi:hypothetical protein
MESIRVTSVRPLAKFVVELGFSDGTRREIDLDPYLHGEVFEPIRDDVALFSSVEIKPGERTISWPNGADIDPYTLYYGLLPEWSKEDEELENLMMVWKAERGSDEPASGIPTTIDHELELR